MPEPVSFGPEDLQRAVEAAGGRYVGLQARRGQGPLLLFDDPETRSTLTLDPLEAVRERVRGRLTRPIPPRFVQLAATPSGGWLDAPLVLFALAADGTPWLFRFDTGHWTPLTSDPNPRGGPR